MLPDAGSIQESEVEQLNRRNAARGRPEVTPIYTPGRRDRRARCLPAGRLRAAGPTSCAGVRARYWNAGHLLGSASIEIEIAGEGEHGKPLRLLVSGDIGPDAKLLQPDPEAPAGLDYVICESTYGDADRAPDTPRVAPRTARRRGARRARRRRRAADPGLRGRAHPGADRRPGRPDGARRHSGARRSFSTRRSRSAPPRCSANTPTSLESDVDVERLLNRRICASPRRWTRARRSPARRLPHHHRRQRHVRRRPHPPSPEALAVATQRAPCCWSASRRRARSAASCRTAPRRCASRARRSGSRRASAGSTTIPAMPTARSWRAGSRRGGRSSAACSWCMARKRRSPAWRERIAERIVAGGQGVHAAARRHL